VDRIRAPLGLLVATELVFGYHFAVWRQDRAVFAASGRVRPRTIGHVFLVAGSDAAPLRRVIDEVTGAGVTVWKRADGGAGASIGAGASTVAGGDVTGDAGAQEKRLAAALEGVAAPRVLVVADQHGGD
jgi:hypothetical protein